MKVIDHLRQSEYTGENRCTACTAVNVAIAASVSASIAVISTFLGASVFAFSLGTIYLRGYLVPGTPTLSKRYLPEYILRWFDKDSTVTLNQKSIKIDPEQILLRTSAVKPCKENTDLCLTPEFQQVWREHIHTVREHNLSEDHLRDALNVSSKDNRIAVEQYSNAFVAHTDDTIIGQWSSQAAVIADVAAATELSERLPNWSDLAPAEISHLLMSLRIFVKQCPKCDGPIQIEQEVVESCCRSYDVIASGCQDCDARLFEMEWNNTATDDSSEQPNPSAQATA